MLLHLIMNLINNYGYIIIALFIMIETLGVPLPGETSLIAGAVYAALAPTRFHITLVILFAILGASIGDNLGYLIGRKYGKRASIYIHKTFSLKKDYLEYTGGFFKKYGMKTVFFGRFISLLRMFVPITAGIHKLDYKQFFIYNVTGAIVWATLYGILGYTLGENIPLLLKILQSLTFITVAIVVVIVIYIIYRRRTQVRKI
ncbi:MAG: DedA family protein [Patescibacteria group bacterium]